MMDANDAQDDDVNMQPVDRRTTRSRKMARLASTAFGDDGDASAESPVRKKQNTFSSSAEKKRHKKPASLPYIDIAKMSIHNGIRPEANSFAKNSDDYNIDRASKDINPFLRLSMEKEEKALLDLVPPDSTTTTRPMPIISSSNNTGGETLQESGTKIQYHENSKIKNLETQNLESAKSDGVRTKNNFGHNRSPRGGFIWIWIFFFANLCVCLGLIWTGLLLNERAEYQLEALACREQLQQVHYAIGRTGDFEGVDNNDGKTANVDDDNGLAEQQFYWQELEAQVRYWKKEAKKYQRYGDGFKEQCREDLRQLLPEDVSQQA
mmetsp:Transcript_10915/g.25448  ORF Transcript_10915/g.25448 Transcript_10915/m.25448 type:complete len:322 (+) Transcript_10915:146-1111(+)